MTKKLFVVLVVITAMLVSFSLVIGAKKAHKGTPLEFTKPMISQKQSPTAMPPPSLTGKMDASALYPPISTATTRPEKIEGYSPPGGSLEGIPKQEGGETCTDAYAITLPFSSTGYTCDNVHDYDEACPYTGSTSPDVVYSYTPSSDQTIDIDLGGSYYDTKVYVYEDNCVPPYYACNDDYYPDYTSAIMGLDIYAGHTYYIVIDGYGGDCGDYIINVGEHVPCDVVCPPNGIPEDEPICEDDWEDVWNGGCNSTPPAFNQTLSSGDTVCGTSGTYLYDGLNYRDTDWFRFEHGGGVLTFGCVGEFPLQTILIDAGSEDCVDYEILDYRQVAECDTAVITMDVPAGVYWLWVGPSIFEGIDCGVEYVAWVSGAAAIGCCQFAGYCDMMTEEDCINAGGTWFAPPYECIDNECQIPVDTLCHLQWDNGTANWYYSGFDVGDQQGNYFDPEAMCTGCGPDVYPFLLSQVSGVFYDYAGVGSVDVIFHVYDVADDPCTGPGGEIYSFPATITTFYPDEAVVMLPDVLCLEDDFILTVEYASGTLGSIPCLLWTNESVVPCVGWIWHHDYSPPWYAMEDFWAGVGYHMLRADGVCNSGACAEGVPCDLIQDEGQIAYYFGSLAEGDEIAKWFDPEVYCTPPVYPYKIHDVQLYLYDFAGAGTVDLIFNVYLTCQDSCDGPGTKIYSSDPVTVTTFYPDMAEIVLPDVVCVFEPFYIGVEWASGVAGSTPSFLMEPEDFPCDTCHAWFWFESAGYSPPWWEWHDFWSPPIPGCPIVRVSGFTEDPDCQFAPCDTHITMLPGGESPYYIWTIPDAYGDDFFNERFDMPVTHGGRLESFDIMFYADASVGDPDADLYVWLSDGLYPLDNNPPYQAIAQFQIPYADLAWYPTYNVVDAYSYGITFDPGESFHIGYSHADQVNDVLAILSDDGYLNSDRSTEWYAGAWGTMLDDWGVGVDFLIDAYICDFAPEGSTFVMDCDPSVAYGTPGDPPTKLYTIDVDAVSGYNLPVTLSLLSVTPPENITASFDPNGVPVPFTSDVYITIDAGVPYGDYTLTFQGVGDDGQTKTCDVTLTVQPPYDEGVVHFFHGLQRTSSFGAIGNDASSENFVWYGVNYLFDGTLISAVPSDPPEQRNHMALDVYNCEHLGFIPTEHMVITDEPWCAGDSAYEEYYGEVAYSHFYTEEDVISCEYDSLFVIGLNHVESTDFSIKIKIYYNPTSTPIPELWIGLFEDWDIGDAYNNFGDMDTLHNIIYMYDPVDPTIVFGAFKVPFYNEPMYTMRHVRNPAYVWPNQGFCDDAGGFYGLDSLWWLMTQPGFFNAEQPDTDMSILMVPPPFSLNPGEKHIEIWIDFGRNLMDGLTWEQWYKKILRYCGFYRGDVNASDTLELPTLDVSDLVYLINYLFKDGPAPLPFADQGNVNGAEGTGGKFDTECPKNNVNVGDVVYLYNYIYYGGPAPIDYVRFIPQYWPRPSLFTEPNWQ